MTNNTYDISVSVWEESQLKKSQPEENSLWRFTTAANRVRAFEPSSSDGAITYAFDTLEMVSRDDTVWSFVFDPIHLRVHFRTNNNPRIRYLDFSDLDFYCHTPVRLLDVHTDRSGDISDKLVDYTHAASFDHSNIFFTQFEGFTMSPLLVDTLLWGLESFPCLEGDISTQTDLVLYRPLPPPTVTWAGLAILHHVGPVWGLLTFLSLSYLIWRTASYPAVSIGKRLSWVLVTVLLGPFGLLAYMITERKNSIAV